MFENREKFLLDKKMNKIFHLVLGASALFSLVACSQGPKATDSETFRTKTGVIGVFRQAATFCSEGYPQTIKLGDSTILVKPTWSDEQDNMFISEMKPGVATLFSYKYQCWKDEFDLKLDQSAETKVPVPTSVQVPDTGFCKIVISFAEGETLFSHNDVLLEEQFKKWNVAVPAASIPYCNIIDNKGGEVSFANKDSLQAEKFKAAIKLAANVSSDDAKPLIMLDSTSDMISWNSDRSRVLMVVWHNDPKRFEEGSYMTLEDDVLWVVADKEFRKWYNDNKRDVVGWNKRLHELLGYSMDTTLTHFSTVWVDPHEVFRAAYVPDPMDNSTVQMAFSEEFETAAANDPKLMWFMNWFQRAEPKMNTKRTKQLWNRLGYTFDWSEDGQMKYGLSQFIIAKDANVVVNFTRTNKAFLNWLDSGK